MTDWDKVKIDARLEEIYLRAKYGEKIDIVLARSYDAAQREIAFCVPPFGELI